MAPPRKSAADEVLDTEVSGGTAVAEAPGVIRVPLKHLKTVKECSDIRSDLDNDKSLESLKASIKTFGILTPLLAEKGTDNGDFIVIAGHRRLRCAKDLGLDDVPVFPVDTASQTEAVGKLLDRARPSVELVRQVIGLVDNTAREALGEVDTLSQLRFLIDADKSGSFKRGGSINATALAKALGTGYEYMRNRVHVLDNFTEKEIKDVQAAIDQGRAERGRLALTWSDVWASLRKGGVHIEALKRLIWGGPEPKDEDEGKSKKRQKAEREIVSMKRGVRNQALDDAGISVRFVGAPGTKALEAEVTVRTRLKGTSFAQERGNENIAAMFEAVVEAIAEFKKTTKDAEVRESLRGACDSATAGLRAKLA